MRDIPPYGVGIRSFQLFLEFFELFLSFFASVGRLLGEFFCLCFLYFVEFFQLFFTCGHSFYLAVRLLILVGVEPC